jgi:outer membrane protein assembly factor BamB
VFSINWEVYITNNKSFKISLAIGIVVLFIVSSITPIVIGYNIKIPIEKEPQSNNSKHVTKIDNHIWPMNKNNAQRSGRTIYDASQNKGGEKWKYPVYMKVYGSATIDKNGTIYVGTPFDGLQAVYPNGTMKWQVALDHGEYQAPAIAPDGTIYVGTFSWLYAFYPNGTRKWRFDVKGNYFSEPVFDSNGTVYVSTQAGYVYAIYSNGTLKWKHFAEESVFDVALDKNGNVYYTGFSKNRLCCLSQNGSLKWTYKDIGLWHGPVIGDDGTIYITSGNLTALYPEGTKKWSLYFDYWYGFPSIAPDGTLVLSGDSEYITSLDPADGNIIWQYKIGEWASVGDVSYASIDSEGTIYFAYDAYNNNVGFLGALNPDGTLKRETSLTTDIHPYDGLHLLSTPSIGSDGTVYITSGFDYSGSGPFESYLHAIGMDDPVAPEPPTMSGPNNVKLFRFSEYTLKSNLPPGIDVYYFIDWDDMPPDVSYPNRWIGPFSSDEEVKVSHFWKLWGDRTIKVKVKTDDSLCSPWSYFDVKVGLSRNRATYNPLFLRFLEQFPILQKILLLFQR